MNERIIIIPKQNKLSLSLAYQNKAFFNVRIFTPIELARESLLRSGKICDKEFVSRNEELIYYKEIVENIDYFKTTKLKDIKNINQTINTIRELVVDDEIKEIKEKLSTGIFKKKNDSLYETYEKYINKLNNENKVDTIGLLRYAIKNTNNIDTQIIILKEYPLQPIEKELINKVTSNIESISLYDLFEINPKNIHIDSYKNCYGSSNEAGVIIDDIFTKNNKDQSVIACADYSAYSQIFYDYACRYNIPVTFGNGISIVNSYPGKLLQLYHQWSNDGNFGWEPFFKLIYSPYFNLELLDSLVCIDNQERDKEKFFQTLSRLRLTNNKNINIQRIIEFKDSISRFNTNNNNELTKYVSSIEAIATELALPIEDFLNKYITTRNNNNLVSKIDEAAKKIIINELKTIRKIGLDITDDVIETLLRKQVYKQSNKPGHIHITTIDDAITSLRNNLYVCGLSSTIYPGSPKENPLFLDCDLESFNNNELTSEGKIKRKKETLFNLIGLASALDNTINLSYPGLNVSELKHNNASSLMFEIYKLDKGEDKSLDDFKKDVIPVTYFEPSLSKTKQIGESYNKANEIIYKALNYKNENKSQLSLKRYSPSSLNVFFNCKKQFFYQYLIGIPIPEDYDPYEVISATEQGSLIHMLMEYLADNKMSLDEFKKLASDVFDEYMKISVPLILDKVDVVKEQFVEMIENGWKMDNDNPRQVCLKEEDKTTIHNESGVMIHGFPDRVENTVDGKVVIVDFKTERDKYAHKKDDIDSCLQVVIYAYIVEKEMHKQIDHLEYRMLRFEDGMVTCKYDQDIKNQLAEKLIEFKNSIDSGDFSIEPMSKDEEKEKCKYCKYGPICGKVVIENE